MHSAMNADEGDPGWADCLEVLTVPDRDKPIPGTVDNVGVTIYVPYPFVCAEMIAQYISNRQNGKETGDHFAEVVIGRIEYEVTGFIVCRYFAGKATANAAAIHDNVVLGVLLQQRIVYKLHISKHFLFATFACAFAKAAVIYHHHIIIIAVEIAGIFGPAFYTAAIAVEIEDEALGRCAKEMQAVDAHAGRYIKKQFVKRHIVFELEIGW